jgi:hypothetical protein
MGSPCYISVQPNIILYNKKSQGDTSVLKQKQVETQLIELTRVNKLV